MNKEKSVLKNAVNLWADIFGEKSTETVAQGLNFLVVNNTILPSITEIKQHSVKSQTKGKLDEGQTWQLVKRALTNSVYSSKEKPAKLPPEIQRVVCSAVQLYRWAMLDGNEVKRQYLGTQRNVRQMFLKVAKMVLSSLMEKNLIKLRRDKSRFKATDYDKNGKIFCSKCGHKKLAKLGYQTLGLESRKIQRVKAKC